MGAYMKISVIVPYFNARTWIRRCCESLHKNKGEFEFILVDDHSTDDSAKIVKEYADIDDRFFMYENIHAKGVSGARNTGLDHATGEWVTFLDADDHYSENAYNKFRAAIRETNLSMIQLNHMMEKDGYIRPRLYSPQNEYHLDGLPKLWPSVCIKLFKKELIENLRFLENLRHGEDEIFTLNCLIKTRRLYVTDISVLIYHKDNPNSLSTTTSLEDLLGEQKALCEFADKHKDDPELLRAVRQRQSELWNNAAYKRTFGG
jgi:CDP-ribitol ribitolphosphotransferase / teichoic acid ribitol-phosphate polymerase